MSAHARQYAAAAAQWDNASPDDAADADNARARRADRMAMVAEVGADRGSDAYREWAGVELRDCDDPQARVVAENMRLRRILGDDWTAGLPF